MRAATRKTQPVASYEELRQWTLRACEAARESASAAAEAVANRSTASLAIVNEREEELDTLDRQINEAVTAAIAGVDETRARELLSCLKYILELERVGDLLMNFSNRLRIAVARIDDDDASDLVAMARLVEKMLGDASTAFSERDPDRVLVILRADTELDRLRNLVFVRHIENPEGNQRQESFHIVFMSQTLERAGDHVKNLGEEVCHLVTGRSIRHLIRATDKPFEQMWADWMRRKSTARREK